jgi:hypothetical protein
MGQALIRIPYNWCGQLNVTLHWNPTQISQLWSTCTPLCNVGIHFITRYYTHAKILVISALKHKVSHGDTNGEVGDH